MDLIWVTILTTPDGSPHAALFPNEDAAWEYVDEWVQAWWDYEAPGAPMPDNRADRIDQYFTFHAPDETYYVEQVEYAAA